MFSDFWNNCLSLLESKKPDINEDISRMVLYLNKNYSAAERFSLIEGVKRGVSDSILRDIEFFKEKYEQAHKAIENQSE